MVLRVRHYHSPVHHALSSSFFNSSTATIGTQSDDNKTKLSNRIKGTSRLFLGPGGLVLNGSSYSSPSIEVRTKPNGEKGVFATKSFQPGEIITIFAGDVLTKEELVKSLPEHLQRNSLQIDDNAFLAASKDPNDATAHNDPAEFYNHSCDPSAVINGNNILAARKLIQAGEEITFDYGSTDSANNPDKGWQCGCGAVNCRGQNVQVSPFQMSTQYGLPNISRYKARNLVNGVTQ